MSDPLNEYAAGMSRADIDAEMYVLGAVLLTGGRVMDELVQMRAEDFHRPVHELLWDRMRTMHAKGEPLEPAALAASLMTDPIRGVDITYIHTLVASCVSPANAGWYAEQVHANALLRRLARGAVSIMQLARETPTADVEEAAASARGIVDDALADIAPGTLSDIGALMMDAMDRWDSAEQGLVPTGLIDFDRMLSGGLRPGHLMVIGARPAIGKSFVASVISHHVARAGFGTYMASLEMMAGEMVDRIVADVASVNLTRLTERKLDPRDWERVSDTLGKVADWPLVIDDRPEMTVAAIRARALEASRRMPGGLRLVIVDYLQLVKPDNKDLPRHEQVSAISRGLKLLARQLGITVIALAQLNRGPESRRDKRPEMADLRESGAIEADADEILLLHRDQKDPVKMGIIEFIIEKNRHGQTGTLPMTWLPQYARVAPLARTTP